MDYLCIMRAVLTLNTFYIVVLGWFLKVKRMFFFKRGKKIKCSIVSELLLQLRKKGELTDPTVDFNDYIRLKGC